MEEHPIKQPQNHEHHHEQRHEHQHEHHHEQQHEHQHEQQHEHQHEHRHEHHHEHQHEHQHEHGHDKAPAGEEILALLAYMVSHNKHHAEELIELSTSASGEAAAALRKAIALFQEGNRELETALSLMRQE